LLLRILLLLPLYQLVACHLVVAPAVRASRGLPHFAANSELREKAILG